MSKDLSNDSRFDFGPPPIQTAQDALMAFLRQDISEEEFRAACGKYGVEPSSLIDRNRLERVDAAYEQTIPDDIYTVVPPEDDLEARQKAVAEKEKIRTEAQRADGLAVHEVKENQKLPEAQVAKTK